MNNNIEQSLETNILNSANNDIIDQTEDEQKDSIYDSNIIIEDNYGYIKVYYK